ncbi:DUF1003 domain-containing protein [Acuticoccus sediminis]|uniref:DUF1003 domain-containing protein n=1 Tax=Acuticoccus sediminis TaxID=2184697 RepID=UPI001CFCB556|nr:DUF1003 domain-containing protein [Acuticoccus sediminis]
MSIVPERPGRGSPDAPQAGSAPSRRDDTGGTLPVPDVACVICGQPVTFDQAVAYAAVRPTVSALLARDHPAWREGAWICRRDLDEYRRRYITELLTSAIGELGPLEREVIESITTGDLVTEVAGTAYDAQASFGERMADRMSAFGGSWGFILSFCAICTLWMILNVTGWLFVPFDPYPFILLNLALSTLAAIQAPIIIMSQRRLEAKDRLRAENDYQVNLKAELEVRQIHEKIDYQLTQHIARLERLEQLQAEVLARLH